MVNAALPIVAFAAFAASSANAHGVINKPGLKFTGTAYGGDFSSLVPMTSLKPQAGDIFTNYPDANLNAQAFGRAFKASQYKSLKEFILKNQDMSKGRKKNPSTPECGFTDPTGGAVQTLPDQIEWYGGQMNHPGPCEAWCDDELVLPFDTNCQAKYPTGKFPYDKTKCVGKNRLTFYWMSTLLEWQVYIDCSKIGNGSPAAATPSAGAPKPSGAPAAVGNTTKPSAPSTPTTTKPNSPSTPITKTPAPPASAKPSTAPAPASKPSATTKCKVRRN